MGSVLFTFCLRWLFNPFSAIAAMIIADKDYVENTAKVGDFKLNVLFDENA